MTTLRWVAGFVLLGGCASQRGASTPPAGVRAAPAVALETVEVPASGAAVATKTSLEAGTMFLLRASGSVDLGGKKVDAEFGFGGAGVPDDELAGVDLGVDVGMKQIHAATHTTPTPPGPGRMKWHGGYRDDHVYFMTVTGEGQPLSLSLTRPAEAAGGAGGIAVSLFPLSPPPKMGPELDLVKVPVTKTVVTSTMSTQSGKVYLLQASGAGKVGGGGTHQGDAEYMDWDEAGTKKNEGEAGADFGIGVDEIVVGTRGDKGSFYPPRLRWWGPWRRDHTYYMLFTGTGKPIQFLFFDSGYKDNSPTDQLAVKIFDVP